MKRSVVVLLISGAFAFVIACTSRVELPPRNPGSKIYFVPIGDFPADQMQQLADYYHRRFGLEILTLKSMAVPATAEDEDRRQLVAEKLIDDLRSTFPELAADPKAILIGFTSLDMYPVAKHRQTMEIRVWLERCRCTNGSRVHCAYESSLQGTTFLGYLGKGQVEKDRYEGYRDSLLRALAVRQSEECFVQQYLGDSRT